ncbi:hypothetical protein [Pimelobacter simplex]|uniref:hypothetical protein n=1 Tax=Nocardioides simplex TaxID=2045 RepID=UPI0019335A4B|nr:hypothetical protein [Pimelobacter simplex]
MWIDEDGVLHTVALPDPTILMTEEFRMSLDLVLAFRGAQVRGIVEEAQTSLHERDWSFLVAAEGLIAAAPPSHLLRGEVTGPEGVADAISRVEPEWRLDALMALDDYID